MPSQSVYLVKYWRYNTSTSTWELNSTKNDDAANITYASGATDFTSSTWKPWANTTSSCYLIGKPEAGVLPISANRGTSNSYYSWDVTNMSVTSAGVLSSTTLTPASVYLKQAWEFSYIGTGLLFTIPATGTYCFECWGASGGSAVSTTSTGGYVKGNIHLSSAIEFYIYVGQRGSNCSISGTPAVSFNGGGRGIKSSYQTSLTSASGGGATDIRTKEGLTDAQKNAWANDWNNVYGLRGRIIVAAGGGGRTGHSSYGAAGGLSGYSSSNSSGTSGNLLGCSGATQTTGGVTTQGRASGSIAYTMGTNGSFGVGGAGGTSNNINCGGGGGGGYWGGAGGGSGNVGMGGVAGSGGSSYISGHRGCVAIASGAANTAKTGTANSVEIATHYSGMAFIDGSTEIIDGTGYEWTTVKGSRIYVPKTDFFETTNKEDTDDFGHIGNGFARITQLSVD